MPALHPHQRLGEFEIVRLLGKGGMGQVYEARQLNPARLVALKVLAPWLAANDDALERFWREAAVPAQLDHPAIVRIISTGRTDEGIAYYVMHLVRGVSLSDLIRKAGEPMPRTILAPTTPPSEADRSSVVRSSVELAAGEPPPAALEAYHADRARFAARLGAVAARALEDAHRKGFLHRDIKPSNLMIDGHGQLYLVDFGLTRALAPDADGTRVGPVRGTPWYMSPEQARGEPVDQRSDIYSLGVTLYELLTQGQGPFTASRDNSEAVLAQVREGQHLPLRTLAPAVPRKLEQIVQRAMHFRSQRRYSSAAALACDLEEFERQASSTLTHSRPSRPALPSVSRLVWVGVAGVLLLLAIGAGLTQIGPYIAASLMPPPVAPTQPDEPPPPPTLKDHFHRERPLTARTPLLREDCQPVISRRLWGQGGFVAAPAKELVVQSPSDNHPTIVGLDFPDGAFEFSIELRQGRCDEKNVNNLGVVLGWHDQAPDPQAVVRVITIQLDERPVPMCPFGLVTVGTGQFQKADEAREAVVQVLRPLLGKGLLPLPAPKAGPGEWHALQVKWLDKQLTVVVDGGKPEVIDMTWLKNKNPGLKNAYLEPRGALGVWVQNGLGYFRNATIMALAEAKE